jgi:hypothetical protein
VIDELTVIHPTWKAATPRVINEKCSVPKTSLRRVSGRIGCIYGSPAGKSTSAASLLQHILSPLISQAQRKSERIRFRSRRDADCVALAVGISRCVKELHGDRFYSKGGWRVDNEVLSA